MPIRLSLAFLLSVCLLAACGGGAPDANQPSPRTLALMQGAPLQGQATKTEVFKWTVSDYTITDTGTNLQVASIGGTEATRTVSYNSRLRFTDFTVTYDNDGVPGQVYRLYQAAFDRKPDADGLSYWLSMMDQGATLDQVAEAFTQSGEYRVMYADVKTNSDLVGRYYQHVLHRAGDAAGASYWTDQLSNKGAKASAVLIGFSESTENQLAILPTVQAGIRYREMGVAYIPVADPGPTRNVAPGSTVTLDGSASLRGSGIAGLSYAWTLKSRPAGSSAALVLSTTAHPSFIADQPGIYEFNLVVSDEKGSSRSATARVIALWSAAGDALPKSGNYIYLESDNGDYVGAGGTYLYTSQTANLGFSARGPYVHVSVSGDQWWTGDFQLPTAMTRVVPGLYQGLTRYPFNGPMGGLDWSGEGRGCNTETGWIFIENAVYSGDSLSQLDLRFEEHCEGGSAALHGQIHWSASEAAVAPGPVSIPADLWQASSSALPASGNYIYIEGGAGDYISGGRNYLFTPDKYYMNASASAGHFSVNISGGAFWSGDFQTMNSVNKFQVGLYDHLQRYPFHNPARGGLSWSGDGRGCNTLTGWFAVDNAVYTAGKLSALDLRFEQHCEGGSSYLHGKLHWVAP